MLLPDISHIHIMYNTFYIDIYINLKGWNVNNTTNDLFSVRMRLYTSKSVHWFGCTRFSRSRLLCQSLAGFHTRFTGARMRIQRVQFWIRFNWTKHSIYTPVKRYELGSATNCLARSFHVFMLVCTRERSFKSVFSEMEFFSSLNWLFHRFILFFNWSFMLIRLLRNERKRLVLVFKNIRIQCAQHTHTHTRSRVYEEEKNIEPFKKTDNAVAVLIRVIAAYTWKQVIDTRFSCGFESPNPSELFNSPGRISQPNRNKAKETNEKNQCTKFLVPYK